MYDVSGLGARIRQLRMKKGLTQERFAKELGISAQAVSKWETGIGCPDISSLPLIASILETSIDSLFGEIEPETLPEEAAPSGEPIPGELIPTHQEVKEPAEGSDIRVVFSTENLKCYSNMTPDHIDGMAVYFADGSIADLSTRTIVNYGNGIIEIREIDPSHSASSEDLATAITQQINTALEQAGVGKLFEDVEKSIYERIHQAVRSEKIKEDAEKGTGLAKELVWNGVDIDSLDILLSGNANVTVHSGTPGQWRVVARGRREFLNNLHCIEDGNVLKLETTPYNNVLSGGGRNTVEIHTGFEQGVELDVNIRGSGNFSCEPSFASSRITISGSGDVNLIDTGNLTGTISGSGDLTFVSAKNTNLTINGSGDIEGGDLEGICEIKINGSGDANFGGATGEFDCRVSGSGDVKIGTVSLGRMNVAINGSGDVIVADGKTDYLDLKLQGSSDFRGDDITVGELTAVLSGPSDAYIGRLLGKSVERISRNSGLHIRSRG